MSVANTKFAFININRDVKLSKDLSQSIKKNGVLLPIVVAKASEVADADFHLVSAVDGKPIEGYPTDVYVVLDGQHRITAVFNNNKEEYELEEKSHKEIEEFNRNKEENERTHKICPTAYAPNIIESIPTIEYDRASIGDNINDFIITLNSTSHIWKASDYISNTAIIQKDDKTAKVINALQSIGFTISTISRYLAFNNSRICPKSVQQLANGVEIEGLNIGRGLYLVHLFITKGFDLSFIKKRYLIDFLKEKQTEGDKKFGEACNVIANMSEDAVKIVVNRNADNFGCIYKDELKKYKNSKEHRNIADIANFANDEYVNTFIANAENYAKAKSLPRKKKEPKPVFELPEYNIFNDTNADESELPTVPTTSTTVISTEEIAA